MAQFTTDDRECSQDAFVENSRRHPYEWRIEFSLAEPPSASLWCFSSTEEGPTISASSLFSTRPKLLKGIIHIPFSTAPGRLALTS